MWTVFIEYLELNQKLYCLEYNDHRIAHLTQEQYESFKHILERIKELEDEFKAGKELWIRAQKACKKHALRGDKLDERIKGLEAALKKYGNCLDTCSFRQGLRANSLEKCDCGLEKALKGE